VFKVYKDLSETRISLHNTEDAPADNTEEDQEGKCTIETERYKMQAAVENEIYEDVHIEVAKIVLHEGNCMTGAEVNNVLEPVKTDMWNKIVSSERDLMCGNVKTKFQKEFSL
jgi:hypothetical protein